MQSPSERTLRAVIRVAALVVGVLMGLEAATLAARAATFTVNNTADTVDVAPGDAACADANGACTLRAAAMETNAFHGPDTIVLPAGTYLLQIPGLDEDGGATGDLDITDGLSIQGAGSDVTTIDGNGGSIGDRVIHVIGAITVDISDVTIRNGKLTAAVNAFPNGAGILNEGTLTLTRTTVSDCTAIPQQPYYTSAGGGVYSEGSIIVVDGLFQDNSADAAGAIYLQGSATITRTVFASNHGPQCAGVYVTSSGVLTATDTTFVGNSGAQALFNGNVSKLTGCTFSNNLDGAIWNGAALTMTNCTVSGNLTSGGSSGLYNFGYDAAATIVNSTFERNAASYAGGGIYNVLQTSTVTLRNTIVADTYPNANCAGTILDGGGNLSWPDGSCPGIVGYPRLGPLADNGGPTKTHALDGPSAALDAALGAWCPATDQRGVPRPQGPACDIGAFELVVAGLPESDCHDGLDNDHDGLVDCADPDCPPEPACDPCAHVVCAPLDQCHDAGTCDRSTGLCSNPNKPDGAPCSDGDFCSSNDTCGAGVCNGGPPLNCDDGNCCTIDSCDPGSGCVHVAYTAPPVIVDEPNLDGGGGSCPVIWPPDHGYVDFGVADTGIQAQALCGGLTYRFSSCQSSQAEDEPGGGDGNTMRDCAYEPGALHLRAERDGTCSPLGRNYTMTMTVTDACGNTTDSAPFSVCVWHDKADRPDPAVGRIYSSTPGSGAQDARPGANGSYGAACGEGCGPVCGGSGETHDSSDDDRPNLMLTALSNGVVRLDWPLPAPGDPYPPVVSYEVWRRVHGPGPFARIALVPSRANSYFDADAADGQDYDYSVNAAY